MYQRQRNISIHIDIQDLIERAEMMLEQAEKIHSRAFVTARVSYLLAICKNLLN